MKGIGDSNDVRREVELAVRDWLGKQARRAELLGRLDPMLIRQALECFESAEAAGRFLISPAAHLGGEAPVDVAQSAQGAMKVRQLLNAIEHGVYL